MMVSFDVTGQPKSKGNHIAFCPKRIKGCRPTLTEDTRKLSGGRTSKGELHKWLRAVEGAVAAATAVMIAGPVSVMLVFRFARPKTVKVRAFPDNRSTPDIDKLSRAVLDALQSNAGGASAAIADDAQVAWLNARKRWCDEGEEPGCFVQIEKLCSNPRDTAR